MIAKPRLIIQLPADERGLSPDVVKRFDKLTRKLQRTDLKRAQRDDALDERASIEHAPKARRESEQLEQGIAETLALASARGEKVKRAKQQVRIVSRGGLAQAYEDGHLIHPLGKDESTALYEAGKRYRDAFEVVEGLTSGTGASAGFGPKAPQIRVVEAGLDLLAMRAAITHRQRRVLDLICGKDMRIRAAATALRRGAPSTKIALRAGLTTLAHLKIEPSTRRLAEIKAIAAAIATVRS